jgi:cytochrome c-type biogenesis protein CcmH/NrfF
MGCRLLIGALLLGLLFPCAALAADASVGRRAHSLSGDLMSPFCPGRTLADCPSPDAAAVREEIRARLGRGESETEVRALLEARFGDDLRGLPRDAIGWVAPVVILVTGAGLVALALRGLSRRAAPPTGAAHEAADLERELDAEIRRRGL